MSEPADYIGADIIGKTLGIVGLGAWLDHTAF